MNRGSPWIRDLTLGLRFAVTGGRPGWTRTALTALGVGLGVAMLLFAASVPGLLQTRDDRAIARAVSLDEAQRSSSSFLFNRTSTLYRGDTVNGLVIRPDGGDAPAPAGLTELPAPGEMAISPRWPNCSTPRAAPC